MAILLPWLLFAMSHFGTIVPNTVLIKSGSISHITLPICGSALARLAQFYGTSNLVEVASCMVIALFLVTKKIHHTPLTTTHWLQMLMIPATYFMNSIMGGESISYRYGAPTLPILILGGFLSLDAWGPSMRISARWLVVVVALIILTENIGLSVFHLPFLKKSVGYGENVLVRYGKWLQKNSAPLDTVAAYDVGAIGYYSERRILDLIGLNSIDVYSLRRSGVPGFENSVAVDLYRPKWLVTQFGADSARVFPHLPTPYQVIFRDEVPEYHMDWRSKEVLYPVYLINFPR
jgi:hypothetical protein